MPLSVIERSRRTVYGPAHPSEQFVLVGNSFGGSVAVLPVLEGSRLGAATDVKTDDGKVGPTRATNAPKGSFTVIFPVIRSRYSSGFRHCARSRCLTTFFSPEERGSVDRSQRRVVRSVARVTSQRPSGVKTACLIAPP